MLVGRQLLHKRLGQSCIYMCPDINYLIISFVVCYEPHAVVTKHFLNLFVTFSNEFGFFLRDYNIIKVE